MKNSDKIKNVFIEICKYILMGIGCAAFFSIAILSLHLLDASFDLHFFNWLEVKHLDPRFNMYEF